MKTCLVVDDTVPIRTMARAYLERSGFAVAEAEDGFEALRYCAVTMPDAILLARNMPDMDGEVFLTALRRHRGGDRPQVLFCTTGIDIAAMARVLGTGVDAYSAKPWNSTILASTCGQVGRLHDSAA